MIKITCIDYEDDTLKEQAHYLAKELALSIVKDSNDCLFLTHKHLGLKLPSFNLLAADFSTATWSKRNAEGKKQGLVRACKPRPGIKIIDATAGWGRDSAILASFGAEVVMLERNPIMAALLNDALERRSLVEQQKMNLSLFHTDAFSYLEQLALEEYPDIIYIDPMHPSRNKSALVKKDMQVLQDMIGPDEDALQLLEIALKRVNLRVVVKWPQKSKPLLATSNSIIGKTVRFDIYTI